MKAARVIIFFLISIGLVVLIVIMLFKSFPGTKSTSDNTTKTIDLVTYAKTDAVTSMYVDGPVIVDQDHKAARITVDRTQTKIEVINGYEGRVVRQETFPNNSESYASFLKSIEKLGFDSAVATNISADERGFCPTGNRYIFTLNNGANEVVRAWSSYCGQGNFGGQYKSIIALFKAQIPAKTLREVLNTYKISF